jgi:tRNA (cmo5U34)-methyltransferase
MRVGQNMDATRANWSFSGDVPETFVDHIRKSVPFYDIGHDLTCQISDYFCHNDSICYEIGVSTGHLLRKLANHHSAKPHIKWVGIDSVEKMVSKACSFCADIPNITIEVGDAATYDFEKADLFVSYYCIQFIPPRVRQVVYNHIYNNLNWGGALIVFEKVRAPDARFQDIISSLYNDYKLGQGFSAEEILNKSSSLRSVLEPFSSDANVAMMRRAGFVDVMSIMRYLCFEGFLAIK